MHFINVIKGKLNTRQSTIIQNSVCIIRLTRFNYVQDTLKLIQMWIGLRVTEIVRFIEIGLDLYLDAVMLSKTT